MPVSRGHPKLDPLAVDWCWMDKSRWRFTLTGRARAALWALAVPAAAALVATAATAQTHKAGDSTAGTHAARAGASRKAAASDAGSGLSRAAPAPVAGPMVAGASSDAGVVESKTLDGGTHVFKFSELDIEGRLKSPQLVYFLRRVRAEFAAEELGHRTFMREMSETRKESSF
jgi:hypothetical protein